MPISRVFDPYTGGAIGGGDGPTPPSPGTVGWVKAHDLDFAGITPVNQTSASGTGTLAGGDFDGLPYKWDRPSGTVGSVDFSTDGMLVTGATTGSYECSIDISSLVTASSEDDIVVALYIRDIAGITSATRGLRLAISAAGTLASGTNDGMKAQYQSSGIWLPNIMRNDTTTTSYGGTAAIPTEGRLVIRLRGGLMANSAWTAGSTAEPDAAVIDALFLHQISFGAKASPTYSTALWVGLSTIYSSVAELYRVIVYVPGVV